MSIFGNILGKIFQHDEVKAATTAGARLTPTAATPTAQEPSPSGQAPAPPPAAPVSQVDVGGVLEAMAAMKPDHGGNYQKSIVDLLKLLDLDSSLSARRELAEELGVHAGDDGSAEQNIALHRSVMDKLAANGGLVPDAMRR